MVPSQGGRAQLCGRLIVFRSGFFGCGRSCRSWHLGPGPSEIRRECSSRGRIVSALLAGAQGGCLPSRVIDTSLHRGQWEFMKGASPGWLAADAAAARCSVQGPSAAGRPSGRMLLTATPGQRRTRTRTRNTTSRMRGGYLLHSGTILGLLRRCGRYGPIRGLLHSLDAAPGPAFGIVLALSPQYICLHRLRRFDQSQQASGSCS